jgi:hypothetical protein
MYTVINVQTNRKNHIHKDREVIEMGKMREYPRYNVISMRVSDEEREHLENIMERTHKSISDIMREAMEYFSIQYSQRDPQSKAA